MNRTNGWSLFLVRFLFLSKFSGNFFAKVWTVTSSLVVHRSDDPVLCHRRVSEGLLVQTVESGWSAVALSEEVISPIRESTKPLWTSNSERLFSCRYLPKTVGKTRLKTPC